MSPDGWITGVSSEPGQAGSSGDFVSWICHGAWFALPDERNSVRGNRAAREHELRSVFEAIHEALQAAVVRLATIQAKVGVPSSSGVTPANEAPAPRVATGRGASRSRGEWTLPDGDWTAPDGAVTGESLRSRREALGISQAAVAHAAHCSRGLVAEVERGRRRSAMTLSHLSQVLDKLEQQARRN